MNIRRIFSAVLIGAAALLLVSCGGLTSAKGETETFSFSLGTVISEASARNSGLTGTATYTITLKSTQGNAYFRQISNTAAVSALNTMTLDFEDVPVGIELTISVFIETDQELYFEGESEPFTMQTGKDAELSIALEKLFSTPYLLWSYSGQNYTYSQAARLSATATTLPNVSSSRIDNFCWDEDDTLWYVYSNKLFNSESASPFFPSINFVDIDYDYQTKKIFALTKSNNTYHLLVVDSNILKTATQLDSTNTDDVEIMLVVGGQEADKTDVFCAVENGVYYTIYATNVGNQTYIWGLQSTYYTPGTSPLIPKYNYTLSNLDIWGDSITGINSFTWKQDKVIFNDIQVVDSTVYLLAKQRRVLTEHYNNASTYSTSDNQFFSRGALIRFQNTENGFSNPDVAGLTEPVAETIQIPVSDSDENKYYKDSQRTLQQLFELKWTRAIPERDNCTGILISPQKFIAINPKKLVIADCGAVYYTDETGLPKTEKQSRIATVDLESFAITTVNYDKDFGNSQNGSEYTTYGYQRVASSHSGYDFYNESGSSCESCNVFFQLSFELDY